MAQQPERVLCIIGGGERRDEDPDILREFVRCAGGDKARIAVVTVASSWPEETGTAYINVFKQLGARDAYMVDVRKRTEASAEDRVDAIEQATAAFFTGGDQERVVSILGGTRIDKVLHRRYTEGMVVGGTSAGAAMMPDTMVIGGKTETNPRLGNVELATGMGFISGIIIDQHFAQRGRLARLLVALAENPRSLGLGIDEDTAVILRGEQFDVIGDGAVTVLDTHSLEYTNVPDLGPGESIAMFNVKMHILLAGYQFDLEHRSPVMPPNTE